MIDYSRSPISELHLGKFTTCTEFQSWKVNLKTEVCSKTADPHVTMHWVKEVEIAKSIDDLMTSRSIVGRTEFTDYDLLDAMNASALKKLLDRHVYFRRRVSVEEQRAQRYDRFLRGSQIAHMIYEHFRANGAYEAVQGLSDLCNTSSQNDDVEDFDVIWDHELLSVSEMPCRNGPGRFVHINIAGFCAASDCIGFARPRDCSKQWATKLFKIEDICKTAY